jgi:hypothetical protein
MPTRPTVVLADAGLLAAAQRFATTRGRRLPIVGRTGHLAGIDLMILLGKDTADALDRPSPR